MRRIGFILLALLFLLTGCQTDPDQPTTAPTQKTTVPPTEAVSQTAALEPYDLGRDYGGAVRAYALPGGSYAGIAMMGEDLLLFSHNGGTKLTLLSPKSGTVRAEIDVPVELRPGEGSVQVSDQGVGYVDEVTGAVVLLDSCLQETVRIALPEGIQGAPVLSPALDTLYYCDASEIRAMDLETGISRLLKRQQVQSRILRQCLFDGRILTCDVIENDGDSYLSFVSTKTGETLGTDEAVWNLASFGDVFFLQHKDGIVNEQVFGTISGQAQSLTLEESGNIVPILAQGGVMSVNITEKYTQLSYYNLLSGKRTAELTLMGTPSPYLYSADETYIWFVSQEETGQQLLYRWDRTKSGINDERVYTSKRYSADDPDLEGLAESQAWTTDLNFRYGVEVLLGKAAVEQPCDYILEPEYRPEAFMLSLEALDEALSSYPEGFFKTLCQRNGSGMLHICLVRNISEEMLGVQYWVNGEAYIALQVGPYAGQAFHHELCHVLDSFILANSLAYDEWDKLNPVGFTYDLSYDLYRTREDTTYLEGVYRAFVDSYSMTYPKEDRARIFEYAMRDGVESLFESKHLQGKLRQVCVAIRDAFEWEKDERVFPWEQYLEKPLAYTK